MFSLIKYSRRFYASEIPNLVNLNAMKFNFSQKVKSDFALQIEELLKPDPVEVPPPVKEEVNSVALITDNPSPTLLTGLELTSKLGTVEMGVSVLEEKNTFEEDLLTEEMEEEVVT
jgi:hypothetical protein